MKNIKKIGVAGAGTMGSTLGEIFARHGYIVCIYDISETSIESAKKRLKIYIDTEIKLSKITKEDAEGLLDKISFTAEICNLSDVDFLIEAISENIEIKKGFWEKASRLVKENIVLASNTSGLSITEIAHSIYMPDRFVGMHWINPAHIIPLVEIIKGDKTADHTADAIKALCIDVCKKPVVVKDAPGFVLNRIQLAVLRECLHIVEQGIASIEDVDNVVKYALGLRYACLGPFEVADHGGLDIFYNIAEYLYADLADQKHCAGLLKELVENQMYGVKSKSGFYDYPNGKDIEAIQYRDFKYNQIVDSVQKTLQP